MAKTISIYDVLVNFVSLITFMLDVGTDILVTVQFFESGDIIWGSLTAGFVAIPTLLIQIFSLKWHITDKNLSILTCLPHLFLFAPVQRYLRVIRLGLKARSTRSFYDIDRVYREQNDVCILRLLESFLEAAPQLCLQLYIILITQTVTPLSCISAASSLISLAWALTAYSDGLRLAYRDVYSRNWCTLFIHWIWQTSMTAARVMALVVFATVFKAWVFLAAGLHWIAMTIWISVEGTDFGEGPCERGLFQIVAGFIYVYCFLNLREGRSRHRMIAYYLVILLENTALVAVWFVYKDLPPVMDIVTPSIVFGGFLLGLMCLLMYYRFLHPSGPVYMYTVKTVVHNGVLNNQRETYPGIFDVTAGTQLSVLGSDIVELSRDMDRTTLSLSRISNRSSGTFSQQHLQLAWQSGLAGRSSSSDSSLDMMEFGTSRTQNGTLTSSRSASSTRQLIQGSRRWEHSESRGRVYHDQSDRQDELCDIESTSMYRRHKPGRKVFTEKDIYGFHEDRFHGTYHSPVKKDEFMFEAPISLSPLDAAKLWEETTGRLRAPLVGKDDDTLSTLDASDLLDQSYGRDRSVSSWASYSKTASSHSVTVHPNPNRYYDGPENQSKSSSRSDVRQVHLGQFESDSRYGRNALRQSYLDSSLADLLDPPSSQVSDNNSCASSRESIPGYEYPSNTPLVNRSGPSNRSGQVSDPIRNQNYSPRYETVDVSPQSDETEDNSEGTEDESGVFTNFSNKSDRMVLQYQDISLPNTPEPVYAVPYAVSYGDSGVTYQHTQSAPGPVRHMRHTSQGVHDQRLQYGNNEDIPSACRSVLPDTPWKLDYLNLEPLKTVLLKMQHIPENKKQLVREYLKDLNESINSSCQPSPIKVQEFENSPARFGRNIDLFDSDAWHAVKKIIDEESMHSESTANKSSMMPGAGRRSRRSLLSQDSGEYQGRPWSGDSDSGYQPFQRSYLDSDNKMKETSPFGMSRHSAKMSCIRGPAASGAPVRGSPMPVRNRSKDCVERRKSRELCAADAKRSSSQSSLNGKYKKRLSGDNKENTYGINHTSMSRNPQPGQNKHSQRCTNEARKTNLDYRKSVELQEKNPQRSVPKPHPVISDDVCPNLTSSYRQAINNTNRSVSLSRDQSHSDLRLEDLGTDCHGRQDESNRRQSQGTDRLPFQSLQNSPAFSPVGGHNKLQAPKTQSFDTFSSTPKVSSSLHSLALIDVYNSPVEEPAPNTHQGSAQRYRPQSSGQNNVGRAKSFDYIR